MLVKSAIKYGSLAYVARAVSKGVFAHTESKWASEHPQAQQQPQHQQPSGLHYDNAGYLHQSWCDGSCGHQCNGKGH